MIKKSILILFSIVFLQSCLNKENENVIQNGSISRKPNDTRAQTEVVKHFMKWYIQNRHRLYYFKTIDGEAMEGNEDEEGKNYSVNFKEVEKYLAALKESGFLSDLFIQKEQQAFIDGEKYFKENPENDAPPFGFDYDHFFLTQEAFEDDLPNIDKAKYKIRQIDYSNAEVRFYLPICNINYKYSLKMTGSEWLIDNIESIEKL